MKTLSFISLVLALGLVGYSCWLAYFPHTPYCPPYTLIACTQVVIGPGELLPLWWPPLALGIFVLQFLQHKRQKYIISISMLPLLLLGIFGARWSNTGFPNLFGH